MFKILKILNPLCYDNPFLIILRVHENSEFDHTFSNDPDFVEKSGRTQISILE